MRLVTRAPGPPPITHAVAPVTWELCPHPSLLRIPSALAAARTSQFLGYFLFDLLLLIIPHFSGTSSLLGPFLPPPSNECSPHQPVSSVSLLIRQYFTFTFSVLISLQDGNHLRAFMLSPQILTWVDSVNPG